MKNRKFLIRLFAAYVGFVILYTMTSAILLLNENYKNIQYNLNVNDKTYLEQVRTNIDSRLSIAFKMVKQLTYELDVMNFAESKTRDQVSIVNIFKRLQRDTNVFADYGYWIGIAKTEDDIVITPASTMPESYFFQNRGFTKQMVENEMQRTNKTSKPYGIIRSIDETGAQLLTVIRKERLANNCDVIFYISFLEKYFLPAQGTRNYSFFITEKEEPAPLFASAGAVALEESLIEAIWDNDRYGKERIEHQFGEVKHGIYVLPSEVIGTWKYVYITPSDIAGEQMGKAVLNILLMSVVMVVAGILLSSVLAKRMYVPIKDIVGFFKGNAPMDSKDELSFVKENLKDIIQRSQVSQKLKFLKDLLYGMVTAENIKENMETHGLYWLEEEIRVVVLELAKYRDLESNLERRALLDIKKKIQQIAEEKFHQHVTCEMLDLDYMRYAVIIRDKGIEDLRKTVYNILSDIEAEVDFSLVAVISEQIRNIKEIHVKFDNCVDLFNYRFATDKKMVLTLDDFSNLKNSYHYFPLDVEKELIAYVVEGKEVETRAILERILVENLYERKLSKEALFQFILMLTSTIYRILQQTYMTMEQVFPQGTVLYLELKMCSSMEDLKEKILEIFDRILSVVNEERHESNTGFTEEIVQYIHENFQRDLSLSDLAEHFNCSVGHMGKLFSQLVGENFKDYLNIYRVKKAKELIQNSDLKITELAEMVGCNSAASFIRIFKRYEGISPGQYAKNIKKELS